MAQKDKKEIKNNKDKTSFSKSFKAELKKVVWPTPKQLFNNTVAVLTIVLITAIIVFILDLAFESANKYGIDKIKQVVSNSSENQTTDTNNENGIETNNDETENSNNDNSEVNENNDVSNDNTTENNTENNSEENNETTNTSN